MAGLRPFLHLISPFAFAYNELFIDAVLRNLTMINAVGDGGSGDQFANGLTNVDVSHANPYTIVAGGTSLSTLNAATSGSDVDWHCSRGDGKRPGHVMGARQPEA